MRFEFRDFRIPAVLTVLMVVVLAYWAWQTWQRADEHAIGKRQHQAFEISDILISTMRVLMHNQQLGRVEIEQQFGSILASSPYQFFILERDGKRIIQIGKVPANLPSAFKENTFVTDDMFYFTRKVRFSQTATKKTIQDLPPGREPYGLDSRDGAYLLILGRDTKQDHVPTPKLVEHIIFPFVVALLILSANAAAWMMIIRNRSLFQQLEMERTRSAHLEDLGLAAAGLAHETKNPLGIISGIAQQVARDPQVPKESRALLETIVDEIDKSVSRLGLFMTFARPRKVSAERVDARQLIEGIAGVLQPEFEAAGVVFKTECPVLTIMADEEMFRQILVNLILNSLTASSRGGSIIIRLQRSGSHASVEVEDTGSGISKELLPRIFKPYVTGSPGGHGLGLSIVRRFVEDHGWSVGAESHPGQGTVIRISGISIAETVGDAK